ncbi:hypothetical protein [Vibrio hepatarius]|uniref:hypothetical protein n=1 Tax=Vibrio hepatarius TaxID=171383 RepID=UPI001C0A0549|nr:hypothetical protein [Vibrio hepatarius]MBU2895626.1 hypothetical protein [Vibrio hepatarius]
MNKVKQKLRAMIMVAALSASSSVAAQADAINIVQSGGESARITAVVSSSTPLFVSKRLGKLSDINIYKGDCKEVSKQLKRQTACIESKEVSEILVSVPESPNKVKISRISSPYSTELSPKQEIAVTKAIYKALTSKDESIFDTKVAYISRHDNGKYILRVSDYDGSSPETIHESYEPILTPNWSPDGKYLTYVSFESVRASIFIQDIKTKRRIKAPTLRGLNAYPSFNNSESLLVSISKEKATSEIYRYDIPTSKLTLMKSSKRADIFPRRIDSETYVKVGLSRNDTPYAYVVRNGRQKPISSLPLNAISASDNGDIVGLSGNKLVLLTKEGESWSDMQEIQTDPNIESPTISSNGEAIYYSTKENGQVFIKMASNKGKNILSFMINNEDLIQISAL